MKRENISFLKEMFQEKECVCPHVCPFSDFYARESSI